MWSRAQETFIENWTVNILGSAEHRISVSNTQLCHCSVKAVINK